MEISREIKITADQLKCELMMNYYKEVHSKILPYEKLRITLLFIAIIVYTIIFYLLYYYFIANDILESLLSEKNWAVLIFLSILGLHLIFLPIIGISAYYREKLKNFYPQIFKIIGLDYFLENDIHGISSVIQNSKLFPSANQSEEEDVFKGKYNGVELTIAETKIIDSGYSENGYSEKKSPTTLYKGVIVSIQSNKKIKSTTLIKPKIDLLILKKLPMSLLILFWAIFGFFIMIIGIYGIITTWNVVENLPALAFGFVFFASFGYFFLESTILRERRDKLNLQKVELEDVNFAKYYQAYSYDQVEARYLITTAFIDRFMYLSQVFRTKNIRCSFVDNNLVIAISSNKNNFEIGGLCKSLKNYKHIDTIFEQIVAILLIVDYLKLDESTKL